MERETLFADVIVPLGVPNKYTYRVPLELNDRIFEGQRVLVQFGRSKVYTGVVYRLHHNAPDYTTKYIGDLLDDQPVVTPLQLRFWDWLAFYYCANPGDVMNAALPSGLKLSSTSRLQLDPDFNFEETSLTHFTDREHLVLDALHATPTLDFEAVSKILGLKAVQPIVNNLIRKGAIVVYEEVRDKFKPKRETWLRLSDTQANEKVLHDTLNQLEKKAFKQAEALLAFLHWSRSGEHSGGWIKKNLLVKTVDAAALSALVKKNILQQQEVDAGRLQFEKSSSTAKALSSQQQAAYDAVRAGFMSARPVLLHGVTGSGKTEIYIQLIHDALKQEKEILFLIPEIALTTQLITRLRVVFGELVGVYHSRFSENERVEIWNNVLGMEKKKGEAEADHSADQPPINNKKYKIILGARSALFLPFQNLGLIIIDEEHDSSFKQHDPSPRYHARDAAMYLATLHGAHVLMGSATPSLETWQNAKTGKYALAQLNNQFVESGGTNVELCDVKYYEHTQQMKASLTPPLFEAIREALAKKQQVILFQNRRGFAPYTECRQCGHVPQCVQCDVSLIYHKNQQKLVCHYCGYSVAPPKQCSACGSNQLHYKGMGTEKIEEDVELLFPKAKVARMDLDSTRSKYAYKQLIDDFEAGNIDILIGTQMVTKGLDFNNVSVVGVLNADSSFNFPDFRSFERSYQLISQVRGRAGRSKEKGRVFIQTTQPEHPVLRYIIANDGEGFYQNTLADRQTHFYPPFSRLFELNVIAKDLNEVNHLADELLLLLKPHFEDNILGPEFPLVSRIKNHYYKRLLLKTNKTHSPPALRQVIYTALNELQDKYKDWRYKVAIVVDPV